MQSLLRATPKVEKVHTRSPYMQALCTVCLSKLKYQPTTTGEISIFQLVEALNLFLSPLQISVIFRDVCTMFCKTSATFAMLDCIQPSHHNIQIIYKHSVYTAIVALHLYHPNFISKFIIHYLNHT